MCCTGWSAYYLVCSQYFAVCQDRKGKLNNSKGSGVEFSKLSKWEHNFLKNKRFVVLLVSPAMTCVTTWKKKQSLEQADWAFPSFSTLHELDQLWSAFLFVCFGMGEEYITRGHKLCYNIHFACLSANNYVYWLLTHVVSYLHCIQMLIAKGK